MSGEEHYLKKELYELVRNANLAKLEVGATGSFDPFGNDILNLEGTAYAGYLKFRDDVIVEVTPVEDGSSRVDMRSVSQVGVSDLGYNAARIREFLSDLQAM